MLLYTDCLRLHHYQFPGQGERSIPNIFCCWTCKISYKMARDLSFRLMMGKR